MDYKNHNNVEGDDEDKMTDDKFILMGLDDDRAGYIAEVLKNKTAKKILNFLGDIKEASEKDISDKLNMPINTVEYNLKKLVKSGFVKKAKNFFWSVKGKKIPMYQVARKYIIISPNKKPNINYLKNILPVVFIAAVLLVALMAVNLFPELGRDDGEVPINLISEGVLSQFSSQQELNDFIQESQEATKHLSYSRGFGEIMEGITNIARGGVMMESVADTSGASALGAPQAKSSTASESTSDFSATNIQVEGVDEADIVKNDGKYIYTVSNGKVIIVNAYPAEDMKILSEIEISGVNNIFINDDRLIIFTYNKVEIYDVSDREDPELEEEIDFDGNYINSRMIGDYVYIISNKYVNTGNPRPPIYAVNGIKEAVMAEDIYYFPEPDNNYVFTSIIALDVDSGDFDSEVYLTSGTNNVYVSENNIYLTYMKRADYGEYAEDIANEVYFPLLPSKYDDKIQNILDSDGAVFNKVAEMRKVVNKYIKELESDEFSDFSEEISERLEDFEIKVQKKNEQTVVHKINVDKDDIDYIGVGEVPGRILNQFSMEEYDGKFRIATTTGNGGFGRGTASLNHLYILDENLEIIGSVEDLAPGESIYSVRFMGERAYIVTFKKVDPLFVIDVSDPEDPEVLGYLKITGYSNYLHPYDENHVIGIGKETRGGSEDFSFYQGVKISLFDVSDVENPIEKAKIEIGDRGTDSPALFDHKAILFDKEKNLLVLPISLAKVDESKYKNKYNEGRDMQDSAYGDKVWQGVFVLDISLDGIEERGRISHDEDIPELDRYGYRRFDYNKQIKRSLYMDDVLYTISNVKIMANDLDGLAYVNDVEWEISNGYGGGYYEREDAGIATPAILN